MSMASDGASSDGRIVVSAGRWRNGGACSPGDPGNLCPTPCGDRYPELRRENPHGHQARQKLPAVLPQSEQSQRRPVESLIRSAPSNCGRRSPGAHFACDGSAPQSSAAGVTAKRASARCIRDRTANHWLWNKNLESRLPGVGRHTANLCVNGRC
jgi:hypothetical protein